MGIASPSGRSFPVPYQIPTNSTSVLIEKNLTYSAFSNDPGEYTLVIRVRSKSHEIKFERKFSWGLQQLESAQLLRLIDNLGRISTTDSAGNEISHLSLYSQVTHAAGQLGYTYLMCPEKGIIRIPNDSSMAHEVFVSNSDIETFYSFNPISETHLELAARIGGRYKLLEIKSNRLDNEINNTRYIIKNSTYLDGLIFTLEQHESNGDDSQMGYYEGSTAGFIAGQHIGLSLFSGISHFGNSNEIIAVGSSSGKNSTEIYRFNKSQNSVAFLHSVEGKTIENSLLKLTASQLLLQTTRGVFIFKSSLDKPQQLSNLPQNIIGIKNHLKAGYFGLLYQKDNKKYIRLLDKASLDAINEIEVNFGIIEFEFLL